jgi:hypothetical protein
MLTGDFYRLDAAFGAQGCAAIGLQQIVEELHIQFIVFYDEDRFGHAPHLSPVVAIRITLA